MSGVKCGKCLLSEFSMNEFIETVQDYISLIPEEDKAPPDEYSKRLDICKSCDELTDGMCCECGCFVEIRAAKRNMNCPVNKWSAVSE